MGRASTWSEGSSRGSIREPEVREYFRAKDHRYPPLDFASDK